MSRGRMGSKVVEDSSNPQEVEEMEGQLQEVRLEWSGQRSFKVSLV